MENPAAVMSATTAGRRLERILLIAEVSLYLQYTSARIDTRIQEGKIEPKVAAIAPGIQAICRPVNVAELTPIGPGVISAIVIRFVNSFMVSHP